MRRRALAALLAFTGLLPLAGAAHAACPPAGETKASLSALKAEQWRYTQSPAAQQAFALALTDCLASPDPELRDELAFAALQAWMRGGQLTTDTLQRLRERLLATLAAPPDEAGFAQPFAALTLAEVARVDRRQPFLSSDERAALVAHAARYLAGVRDYRGFDVGAGWRHGVAHGADLLLQLALNPALQRNEADTLLAAIAKQVLPDGEQVWRYGEPDRLAAPVFYLARRGLLTGADWQAWFDALVARRLRGGPTTQAQLAQRHNLVAFLSTLYVAVRENPDAEVQARLLPGLRKALRESE